MNQQTNWLFQIKSYDFQRSNRTIFFLLFFQLLFSLTNASKLYIDNIKVWHCFFPQHLFPILFYESFFPFFSFQNFVCFFKFVFFLYQIKSDIFLLFSYFMFRFNLKKNLFFCFRIGCAMKKSAAMKRSAANNTG